MEEKAAPLRVRRALISAHDVVPFLSLARGLAGMGVELWATSGTGKRLAAEGVPARSTEELTGIGSWFGGRVKTLHPKLFGGILAPRTPDGEAEMREHGVLPFDLVAVDLYPFEAALRGGTDGRDVLIDLIDVGGPALLRAAAKNHRWVVPVPGAEEASRVLKELTQDHGTLSYATREAMAGEVFRRLLEYDTAIGAWLEGLGPSGDPSLAPVPPSLLTLRAQGGERLRYGENPHQRAWVYALSPALSPWPFEVVKGDGLSYNNYLDLETSVALTGEFEAPAAAVVKHATPCGVATGKSLEAALEAALSTDPVARYGCAIAVNRPLTVPSLDLLKGTFVDLLVAPEFSSGTPERLAKRPKLKAVRLKGDVKSVVAPSRLEARTAAGRLLVEECDQKPLSLAVLRQVSKKGASPEEKETLAFAWHVVRHVRSNAIVLAQGSRTVGIGGGQTSRVGAVRAALEVAGERAQGAGMASDAYFPFPDGIEAAGKAGVRAVIQPGGSIRDAEVEEAADRYGMAMYYTGWRVFRH